MPHKLVGKSCVEAKNNHPTKEPYPPIITIISTARRKRNYKKKKRDGPPAAAATQTFLCIGEVS